MPLDAGTRLGVYEISAPIGAGGMGEVYRARTTLNFRRDVAVKVLPEAFADAPDRLARFEREAKLLAALNHPNIAAIHGLEESDGVRFLVLELVPGDTLFDRLQRGPIPLEETLRLAAQIADALEAAHAKGVIHRDFEACQRQGHAGRPSGKSSTSVWRRRSMKTAAAKSTRRARRRFRRRARARG